MPATLEFITGRAGTGKTLELFKRVKAARAGGLECFVIVPEQATFETEKSLAEYLSGGFFGCTVLAWKELARKLLDGLGERRAFLSGEGRIMLLRRSVDAVKKDLSVFRKAAEKPGFPVECDTLIAKLKRCGMTSEDVMNAAGTLPGDEPLADKLRDIALIYSELERRCESRWLDAEDMVMKCAERMSETPLAGAAVFIDGGDTMHEYAYPVFKGLVSHARSIAVTLTIGEGEVFSEERRTLEKLCDIAKEAGVRPVYTRLEGRRRAGTPALSHLESELFRPLPAVFSAEPEGLSISECRNRTEEVTEASERIRRAAGKMRFSDIAVIVSDPEGYAPIIKRIFPNYGIPYFADSARSLITYPAARLVISALTACESGFEARYVLETLKTGCFGTAPDDAELFENYLLKTGISGKRLLEEFTEDGAPLEPVRKSIMEPLARLKEALAVSSASSRARAIHDFLAAIDLYGRQKALCERLHEAGLLLEEEENAQVVNGIAETLDQLFVIMGDEPIGMKRFISVVKEGLRAHSVGAIPATVDRVLVGSPDRTRAREVRLLIVLGMNEGLFPKARRDDGVIGDADLELLRAKGFELWKSTDRLTVSDEFAVYRSLAKATERIAFSYPVSIAGAGSMDPAASPCRIIKRLRRAFPLIPVYGMDASPERTGEEAAFLALAGRIRRMLDTGVPDDEAMELCAYFMNAPGYSDMLGSIRSSGFGTGGRESLPNELSARLYGRSLYGSASRLESFNNCPFRHFMQYGMRANEREEREQRNTDLGSFYHEVLEKYVSYVIDLKLDWKEIDDEKTFEILRKIVPEVMKGENGRVLLDTARQRARFAGIVDSVRFTCCAVTRQIARGSFRPMGCEVSFGRSESLYPPLKIETENATFYLGGVIDRIDGTPDGMTRIIDYKSGGKDFDFAALREGLQLQLPLYAAASGVASTVGMYYMPISDIDPTGDEEGGSEKRLTEELMKKFRLSGIMLREAEVIEATEEFEGSSTVVSVKYDKEGNPTGSGLVSAKELGFAMEFARSKAAETLEKIFSGEVTARPAKLVKTQKSACRFCPYSAVCLFDGELSRLGAREIRPVGADEFFNRASIVKDDET